ncbi:MAG: DMT family transporter [Alphaproteobacteria bacterium]
MLKTGPAAGIFWMCTATLISSISGGMVRELSGQIPTMELVFFRNVIALMVLVPIVRRQGVGLPSRSQIPVYALRVLFAFGAMVLLFYALARMPIADVYALQYTIPLFTILLAVVVLKQHADIHSWGACLVGFIGTLIVMRPGIVEITLASAAALSTAFMHAGNNTAIKVLARKDNPEVITLWTNIGMLPLALIPTLFLWVTPTLEQWPLVLGIGLVSSLGGYCFTRAVSSADARIVQPFQFSRMIFATAIGWIMFSELPDVWTWVGAAVIFAASYYVVYREGKARRAERKAEQE